MHLTSFAELSRANDLNVFTRQSINELLERAVFTIYDAHQEIYTVFEHENALYFACFADARNGNMQVNYTAKVRDVPEITSDMHVNVQRSRHDKISRARAYAVGHCVAQAMCDGMQLQDNLDIYGSFTAGMSSFLK